MILDTDPDQLRDTQSESDSTPAPTTSASPPSSSAAPRATSSPPKGVKEFVDAVPGARYIDVADAGHMVAGDQTDHFTTGVLEFLHTPPDRQLTARLTRTRTSLPSQRNNVRRRTGPHATVPILQPTALACPIAFTPPTPPLPPRCQ